LNDERRFSKLPDGIAMVQLRSRISGALTPTHPRFFDLLESAAANAAGAADLLERLVHHFPDHREELLCELHLRVCDAESLTVQMGERLASTFVTPLEREDLHALASALEEFVRSVRAVAALLDVYAVQRVRHPARPLSQLVARCATALCSAVERLRPGRDVSGLTRDVRAATAEGDQLVREGLRELFAEAPEPVELIRWKDLFDRFDDTLSYARSVAGILDRITGRGN
jgi:uncharacterized protein Yka (UPF0111/DUF47 family)